MSSQWHPVTFMRDGAQAHGAIDNANRGRCDGCHAVSDTLDTPGAVRRWLSTHDHAQAAHT